MQYSTTPRTVSSTRENSYSVSAMREHLRHVGTRIFTLPLAQLGYSERLRIAVSLVDSNNNNNNNNNDNNNNNGNGSTSRSSARTEPREQQQMARQRSEVWGSEDLTPRAARRERRRKKRTCDHNDKTFCSKCHTRRRHVYRWYGRPYKLN